MLKNPAVHSMGILSVNSHGQDAHATILLITHSGAAAGRVMLADGL
jgi:hypothetical protein